MLFVSSFPAAYSRDSRGREEFCAPCVHVHVHAILSMRVTPVENMSVCVGVQDRKEARFKLQHAVLKADAAQGRNADNLLYNCSCIKMLHYD